MRMTIGLAGGNELLPFNYQHILTGAIHKWLGERNEYHGKVSLYSFSWLQNVDTTKQGIKLKHGSSFFISSHTPEFLKTLVRNMREDPSLYKSIMVESISIQHDMDEVVSHSHRFLFGSPVLIKKAEGERTAHVTFDDPNASQYLTDSLITKLKIAGISHENVAVRFDEDYPQRKTKIISYKGINNKVNLCPVIVEGTQEQIQFAWNVGVGNGTGIGFGSLK